MEWKNEFDQAGNPVYELTEEFKFRLGPRAIITVPAGYQTNLGTIPGWLHWFIKPAQLREAAVAHDWLCNEDFGDEIEGESGYSRWMADAVLYEMMVALNVAGPIRRELVYAACRGWARMKGLK
jgi:hypothetical protein